jgi:hypothetical protein
MNKGQSYNDLNNLTNWINNQKAFERHKKKLDEIYMNLHKQSVNEFGIKHKAFEAMQNKIKNLQDLFKFNEKGNFMLILILMIEKSLYIGKINNQLGEKISSIQKRDNALIKNQIDTTGRDRILKKRILILKGMENEKIKKENEMMAKRIVGK